MSLNLLKIIRLVSFLFGRESFHCAFHLKNFVSNDFSIFSEHPLAALSHVENMSIVSSFNMAGDAFSDCAMGERTR